MNPPKNDIDRLKLLVQLSDISDLHRAKVAVMRVKLKTDQLTLTPEAKATRIAVLTLAENLLEAEITQLLHDTNRANPVRTSIESSR